MQRSFVHFGAKSKTRVCSMHVLQEVGRVSMCCRLVPECDGHKICACTYVRWHLIAILVSAFGLWATRTSPTLLLARGTAIHLMQHEVSHLAHHVCHLPVHHIHLAIHELAHGHEITAGVSTVGGALMH